MGGLHCTSRSRPALNCPSGPLEAEFLILHILCFHCERRLGLWHEEGWWIECGGEWKGVVRERNGDTMSLCGLGLRRMGVRVE